MEITSRKGGGWTPSCMRFSELGTRAHTYTHCTRTATSLVTLADKTSKMTLLEVLGLHVYPLTKLAEYLQQLCLPLAD